MTTRTRVENAIRDYRIAKRIERAVMTVVYAVLGSAGIALLVMWAAERGGL